MNKMNKIKDLYDRIDYKRKKGLASREIKQAGRQYWRDYCSTLTSSTKLGSVWNMAKRMNNVNSNYKIPTIIRNGETFETNLENANLFADVFAQASSNNNFSDQFKRKKVDVETNERASFENDVTTSDDMKAVNEPFMYHELRNAVRQCKANSAPEKNK